MCTEVEDGRVVAGQWSILAGVREYNLCLRDRSTRWINCVIGWAEATYVSGRRG